MKGTSRITHTGAWVIHVVLIVIAKLLVNELPGISNSVKWSMVNLGYMAVRACPTHTRCLSSCSTASRARRLTRTRAHTTTSRSGSRSTRATSTPPRKSTSPVSRSDCTSPCALTQVFAVDPLFPLRPLAVLVEPERPPDCSVPQTPHRTSPTSLTQLHRSRVLFFPGNATTGTNTPAEPALADES